MTTGTLHIAFLSWEFPPETNGGIGAYVDNAARVLAARGHLVEVFAGGGDTDAPASVTLPSGVILHRNPCADRTRFAAPAAEAILARHRERPFDIVEAPDLYAEGACVPQVLPGVPLVVRCHTPLFLASRIDALDESRAARHLTGLRMACSALLGGGRALAPVLRGWFRSRALDAPYPRHQDEEYRTAAQAAAIVPPSQSLASILGKTWPDLSGRIEVLPYPFIAPPAAGAPTPPGDRVVLFHGRLRFYKGVHTLAAAIPRVLARHPKSRFVFIGGSTQSFQTRIDRHTLRSGRYLEPVDTLAWLRERLAPCAHAVEFTGYLPPAETRARLAAADLVVLPSRWDNFPNACLEAMSAGRAIVATHSGGMRDMLESPAAGVLVPPDSPRRLAQAILRLLEDPPLRHRLARVAREVSQSRYSPATIGEAQENLYRRLIESPRTPAS